VQQTPNKEVNDDGKNATRVDLPMHVTWNKNTKKNAPHSK